MNDIERSTEIKNERKKFVGFERFAKQIHSEIVKFIEKYAIRFDEFRLSLPRERFSSVIAISFFNFFFLSTTRRLFFWCNSNHRNKNRKFYGLHSIKEWHRTLSIWRLTLIENLKLAVNQIHRN